jgi:hypothetical protein
MENNIKRESDFNSSRKTLSDNYDIKVNTLEVHTRRKVNQQLQCGHIVHEIETMQQKYWQG